MRAKVDHVTDCVFLPAHAITRAGYTQFLRRSGWEAKTLFEEGVFTCVLAAPATLPLRRSRGGARLATPSGVSRAARSAVPCRSSAPGHRASRSKYTRDQSRETGSLSRLFGSMETAAKCVSMGHAHCRTRLCGALPQPFYGVTPMLVGSRAGSDNGTRSEHSPEGGDHRGGPCSRQRVRVLQPYFIVPGKGVASFLDLS